MTEEEKAPTEEQANEASDEQQALNEEQAANMSYEDYLRLTNPGMPEEHIQKMIRKEQRYTWIGRVQILLLVLIILVIIYFIISK